MKYYLSPSILSADFAHLGDDIAATEKGEPSICTTMLWMACLFRAFLLVCRF